MANSWVPAITAILSGTWDLLCTTIYPGTNISVALILMGTALILIGFRLLSLILGVSIGGSGGGSNYRPGKGGKAHGVSDKRKGDEK